MRDGLTDHARLARENAAIKTAQTCREMAKRARLRAADARWNEEGANTVPVTRREGYGGTVVETRGRCGGVCSAARTVRIADVSPLESARRRGLTGALTDRRTPQAVTARRDGQDSQGREAETKTGTKTGGIEMSRKYELTDETRTLDDGTVLHRIRAVKDFDLVDGSKVHKGDLGGWVENERNLSQDGKAWVAMGAEVYGLAHVYDSAHVYGSAKVCGSAWVFDSAWVCGLAHVYGSAWVCGLAHVYGSAKVCDSARVFDSAKVCDSAWVYGSAKVCDSAWVGDSAKVFGSAEICGESVVTTVEDYAVYKNTWSSFRWFTYTRSNRMWRVGCFYGTGEGLIAKAYKDSELSGRCYEAIVRAQEAIDKALAKAGGAE